MSSHAYRGVEEKSDAVPFSAPGGTVSLGESGLDVLMCLCLDFPDCFSLFLQDASPYNSIALANIYLQFVSAEILWILPEIPGFNIERNH